MKAEATERSYNLRASGKATFHGDGDSNERSLSTTTTHSSCGHNVGIEICVRSHLFRIIELGSQSVRAVLLLRLSLGAADFYLILQSDVSFKGVLVVLFGPCVRLCSTLFPIRLDTHVTLVVNVSMALKDVIEQ